MSKKIRELVYDVEQRIIALPDEFASRAKLAQADLPLDKSQYITAALEEHAHEISELIGILRKLRALDEAAVHGVTPPPSKPRKEKA